MSVSGVQHNDLIFLHIDPSIVHRTPIDINEFLPELTIVILCGLKWSFYCDLHISCCRV